MGGIETYVRRFVPALLEIEPALEIELFVNDAGRKLLSAEPWSTEVSLVTHPLLGRRYTRALSELTLLGALASRRRLDVLHSVALTGPLFTRPAHVLTIPDVIWLHEPDPAELATARLWKRIVPPVARRAERLLTYSEAARADVSVALGIDSERIDAVPLGAGSEIAAAPTAEDELRRRLRLGAGPIVLSVSALKVHKNLASLVEAMVTIRGRVPDAVLVIPANPTPHGNELQALATRLGIGDALTLPGWVSSADLEGLYASAACFAFPSKREGFGLPVLEAMRRGVAVACSAASSLPEVAGDAAFQFDPTSASDIAAAIERLLVDAQVRERLKREGPKRAAMFTWRRTAEETLETYRRAATARR
jgi:glycosyltransferase involved in cell wall biosynthesis